MPSPTGSDVSRTVRLYVASYANLRLTDVKPCYVLRDQPLKLDGNQLAYLADSLDAYSRSWNPDAGILPSDARQDGQTVKGLSAIVFKRIQNGAPL
jgi:hypothetical protein